MGTEQMCKYLPQSAKYDHGTHIDKQRIYETVMCPNIYNGYGSVLNKSYLVLCLRMGESLFENKNGVSIVHIFCSCKTVLHFILFVKRLRAIFLQIV